MARSNARDRADGIVVSIVDGSLESADIATGAVTSAKIADGAITNAKLAPSARVQETNLVNLTFDSAQTLDLSQGNFFVVDSTGGVNTTLSFANVPTSAKWTYKVKHGGSAPQDSARTADDLANWTLTSGNTAYSDTFTGNTTDPFISGFLGKNGTKLYASTFSTLHTIYEHNLTTPYSIASGISAAVATLATGATELRCPHFKDDGTKLYAVDYGTGNIMVWNLSIPWSLSSASRAASEDYNPAETANTSAVWCIDFNQDGTKMFVQDLTTDNDKIFQYTLSTAWNPSTATYDNKFWNTNINQQGGFSISKKGTRIFITDYTAGSGLNKIRQYSLTTPFDISTVDSSSEVTVSMTANFGIVFDNLYSCRLTENDSAMLITAYAANPDYAVLNVGTELGYFQTPSSLSTLTLPASVKNSLSSTPSTDSAVQHIEFLTVDSGVNVYITNDFVTST